MPKKTSLTLHIEETENGYILKDLTNRKDKENPNTQVSTDINTLKQQISSLIAENLVVFGSIKLTPNTGFNTNPIFGPVLSNEK